MIIAHNRIGDGSAETLGKPSLASWYTQGVSDRLGDRLLMFDNTGAPSWELLRFRPELALAPGFEIALRERLDRLGQLRHPAFPIVRIVEDLGAGEGLAIVSTYLPGRRLSEAFQRPRSAAFVTRALQELLPSLMLLQQHGIAHGVLTADRIMVTSEGRMTIREHVLGSAIERLRLPASRLWSDLGIVVSPTIGTSPALDSRTDVIQLGIIALSLMLGRRLGPADYPNRIQELFADLAATTVRRALTPIRAWIQSALQISNDVFASPGEAHEALSQLTNRFYQVGLRQLRLDHEIGSGSDFTQQIAPSGRSFSEAPRNLAESTSASASIEAAPARQKSDGHVGNPAIQVLPQAPSSADQPLVARAADPDPLAAFSPTDRPAPVTPAVRFTKPTVQSRQPGASPVHPGSYDVPSRTDRSSSSLRPRHADSSNVHVVPGDGQIRTLHTAAPSKQSVTAEAKARDRSVDRLKALRWAVASALVAVAEAAVIGYLTLAPSTTPARETPVVVDSPQPGAAVVVDGRQVGVTPLVLQVGSATRSIQVLDRKPSRRKNVDTNEPRTGRDVRTANVQPATAGSEPVGGVKLSSPIEVTVFEGEKVIGSSKSGPILLSPGRHEVDLVNAAVGYASRRIVDVAVGEVRTLVVAPANGEVSINASPWAEISIDGRAVGGTPLANLSVPVGEHEVVFRHPRFGERRTQAIVRSDRPTQLSVNFKR
jgi:PEGA domain-containing protein